MIHPNTPANHLDGLDEDHASTPLPDEDAYAGSGSQVTTWRIATGVICRGSENGNSDTPYEVRANKNGKSLIIGEIQRYSVEEGHYKDGGPFHVLEAEFKTNRGLERLRINLLNMEGQFKPGGVALRLAQGLAHFKAGDLVCIEPFLGSEPNKFGKKPTFLNIGWFDIKSNQSKPVPKVPKSDQDFGILVREALDALKAAPGYKERPRSVDPLSHYALLCTWLAEQGRQGPDVNPEFWLKTIKNTAKFASITSLSAVDDHGWGEFRQYLATLQPLPPAIPLLQPAAAGALAGAFGGERDPFAND